MNSKEVQAIVAGVVDAVRSYCEQLINPLLDRVKQLEARPPAEKGEQGEKGEKGTQGEQGRQGEAGAQGEKGEKGDQGDPGSQGPVGAEGQRGEQGERGEKGEKGDGGAVGERGPAGERGEKGADGLAGRDGRDGLPGVQGYAGIDGIDGKDGINGKDGFSLDDFNVITEDGGRTITFTFTQEGREPLIRSIKTALLLDRGVFREGSSYEMGDAVSWGGSTFFAQETTVSRPGTDKTWRLAVKRGRDGIDGKAPSAPKEVKVKV